MRSDHDDDHDARDDERVLTREESLRAEIAARRNAEEALRDSQERLWGIITSATDAIITIDDEQRITLFNPAAEAMFRCLAGQAIGHLLERFIPHRFRQVHLEHIQRFGETGVTTRAMGGQRSLAALRADGTEFPVEATISQITVGGQKLYTAIVRDVSQRHRQEEALLESEGRLRAIVETAVDGIITIDERGHIGSFNPAAERIFGYRPEEVIGRNVNMLMPSPYFEEHDQYLADYLRTGLKKIIGIGREVVGKRKDGSTFPMDLAVSETVLGDRKIFTGIVRDITERKRAEAERERLLASERAARGEAERSSRMKDEFLATLSHELRTPLNAIYGWSQMLQQKPLSNEDVVEGLAVIARNAKAQTQLIEDLLDMSRIVSGKLRMDVQRVNLADVIDAAVQAMLPAVEAKGIRLQKIVDPLAGPATGDPNRLQQVVWNLLSNAVKFTPRGGRVQVFLERVDSHVELAVTDTGEGFALELLPHLFERFRQADSSSTRRHGGLGLGLAIVRHLVELHGGSVRAASPGPGQGSTFTVVLPLRAAQVEEGAETVHAAARNDAVAAKFSLRGVKLLVVDDEPDARHLLKRLLGKLGADVLLAGTAAEGLELLRRERPDVLICDIGLPQEDGYAFLRRVRKLSSREGGDTPAVALTAYARSEDRTIAMLAGFQTHLPKPVEPAELLAVVANLAGRVGKG